MGKTSIGWTDDVWNPISGCTKISPGCKFCYAERFAERWRGIPGHHFEQGFDLRLFPERLGQPSRWKKPRRIFVNSMSDLFHEDVPEKFIAKVFEEMMRASRHTFQVLTKRAWRMRDCLTTEDSWWDYPPKHIWLGTSVENQKYADERIPQLLDTPAAVRFLSCEPLLGPVDLSRWLSKDLIIGRKVETWGTDGEPTSIRSAIAPTGLGWVIVGGESGPGARPMDLKWASEIRSQCFEAGVPFFMKQLGGVGNKREALESFPANLRVREFPN